MALEPYRGKTPQVEPTAYVHPAATVIGEVTIGAESSVWPSAVLRADDGPITIGAQTSIQDGTVVHMTTGLSSVTVGDRVTIGHQATIHGCTIEDECLIGMNATILDNAVIGKGSIVGACALVTANKVIPPGSLVLGSPAKVVRPCGEAEQAMIDMGWREYVQRAAEYNERDSTSAQ